MYVVLPKINDEINIKNAVNNVKPTRVMIKLPKFKVEFSQKLNGILVKMGIEKAFSQNEAEFKNKMFVNLLENAYISEVLHKTFIEVDENGTEAAAVTAVLMKTMAAFVPVEDPKEFIADKPFIYFIRDNNSGAILFMGEIVK